MPSKELAIISAQPDCSINELVRQRLVRLAELIRKDGAPYPLTPQLISVWLDVFQREGIAPKQIEIAFHKAEKSCKFWPSPADVLGFVTTAKSNTREEDAARKFDCEVLPYAIRRSPDIREKNPPRISERTRRAINAAGGLDFLRECDRESLQWSRKRFIEAYVRYEELNQDEYLLPAGEVRDLLTGFAQTKALAGSGETYQEMRERGLQYAQELKTPPAEDPNIKRALRAIAGELAPRLPMRSLEEQKKVLQQRGLLP